MNTTLYLWTARACWASALGCFGVGFLAEAPVLLRAAGPLAATYLLLAYRARQARAAEEADARGWGREGER